jgi:hypothetical protein
MVVEYGVEDEDDDNNNNNTANGYGGAEKKRSYVYIQSSIKQGTTTRGVN